MRFFRKIDLAKVPFPTVIQEVDPERERDEMIREFEERIRGKDGFPDDYVMREYDPLYDYFSVLAMKIARESNKVNHAVKNRFVIMSSGDDLEANVSEIGLQREGDESDDELTERFFRTILGESLMGVSDSYDFFVRKKIGGEWGSSQIQDCHPYRISPGVVSVVVLPLLSHYEGKPEEEEQRGKNREKIRKTVENFFNDTPGTSPIADKKPVSLAVIREESIRVKLQIKKGVGKAEVLKAARERLETFRKDTFGIGFDLYRSSVSFNAMDKNTENCEVISPAEDLITGENEAVLITSVEVEALGEDED